MINPIEKRYEKYDLTDKQIEDAFYGTNFGDRERRKLLVNCVFKKMCGYYCGSTINQIMKHLELTTEKGNVTKFGKKFVFEHLKDTRNNS